MTTLDLWNSAFGGIPWKRKDLEKRVFIWDWLDMGEFTFVEENGVYIIKITTPGTPKEDYTIKFENDKLNVNVQNKLEKVFNVRDADSDKIVAKYVDGIMTITIPKRAPPEPKGKVIPIM